MWHGRYMCRCEDVRMGGCGMVGICGGVRV